MITVSTLDGKVGSITEMRLNPNGAHLTRVEDGVELHYWIPAADLMGYILLKPATSGKEDMTLERFLIPKPPIKAPEQPFLPGLEWDEGSQYGWP